MYAWIACLKITLGANICIPIISGLRIDIFLVGNYHIGHTIVTFYVILLWSNIDIHPQREIYIPTIIEKIFGLQANDIHQAIIIKPVNL